MPSLRAVPVLFKSYFNIRRCYIRDQGTRFSKKLFIDKIDPTVNDSGH